MLSLSSVLGLSISALVLFLLAKLVKEKITIRRLGHQAPTITPWWSFGFGFIYDVVRYALDDDNLKFFHNSFTKPPRSGTYCDTVEARVLGQRYIMTVDPENMKAMLKTQLNQYGKGERFAKNWHDLMGDSIITADGQHWRDERRVVGGLLTKERVAHFAALERHVQELIPMLGDGHEVDIKDYMGRLALDYSVESALGHNIDTMHNPEARIGKAFETALRWQMLIERTNELNFLIPRKKFLEAVGWVRNFFAPHIDKILALSPEEVDKAEKDNEKGDFTYLHAYTRYTRDRKGLEDKILTLLFAGRDTLMSTLTFLMFELARQPDIVRDLRQEIADTVGNRCPTLPELKSMKLVQGALNEAIRLYPVFPLSARVSFEDTTIPRGGGPDGKQPVAVPAGTTVLYHIQGMHLTPDFFPSEKEGFPAVNLFAPRRWENWNPSQWHSMSFNGGPRNCIGKDLALAQTSYVLVRLLQNFTSVKLAPHQKISGDVEAGKRKWNRDGDVASAAEKFSLSAPVLMSEIILHSRGPINLVFTR